MVKEKCTKEKKKKTMKEKKEKKERRPYQGNELI
jgi:hypothetical protein